MPFATSKSAFLRGLAGGAPFVLVVAPFSALFGVVATEAGLNLAEVMGFSVLVMAGASQFTAVQLMGAEAPTLVVLAASLAVNLRMAMYSAALTPHLGGAGPWQRALMAYCLVDQSYAASVVEFERRPGMTLPERAAYFFGVAAVLFPVWYAMSFVGATLGTEVPEGYALDFALPVTFLALVAPALRTLAHLAAALVSVAGALVFAWLPYNLGLLAAAALAMAAGAQAELWLARRRAR